jgi:hypothetical protein
MDSATQAIGGDFGNGVPINNLYRVARSAGSDVTFACMEVYYRTACDGSLSPARRLLDSLKGAGA